MYEHNQQPVTSFIPTQCTNTLNTYTYHQLPPTCFGICYTIFRETISLLAQKGNGLPEDGVENIESCRR